MTPTFRDHFSAHSPDYRAFRPTYPPELFAYLASLCPHRDLVWDCGTGSGQAAVPLAEHFARVIATDASASQLASADTHPRVEYVVAPAERSPLADGSADLVTVAQALHWFDFGRYYAEVRRVCRTNGVLAVWTYGFHSVGGDLDRLVTQLRGAVDQYWPPGREHVDAGYRTVPFPFPELEVPQFEMVAQWDLRRVIGYINTWSAVKRFEVERGYNPLDPIAEELAMAWGDPLTPRRVTWDFNLRAGRVNG